MKKSFFIAVLITLIAILWVASGHLSKDANDETVQNTPTDEELSKSDIQAVQIRNMTAEILKDTITVTGRSQAARQVFIAAETAGQISTLSVKKGDAVRTGDLIAKLKIKDRAARVTEAEQLIKQRQIQYDAAKKLSERGFSSDVRVAESRAELETAKSLLKQSKVELSNTVIRAPFNGIINNTMIEVGNYVTSGTEIVDLVNLTPIKVSGFLTEKQLVKIEQGSLAEVTFLDGRETQGTVTFIASAADPQTRTFAIEITAPNDDMAIKEGLTAKLSIPSKEISAFKISPSILSLADDGTIGVKIVSDENIVRFVPIRLLKDTKEFLWVGGLPDNIRLITVGQDFVITGQQVKPVLESVNQP